MNTEGKITITRASTYPDRLRAYKVMLDGLEIGTIKNGQTETFSAPAGTHELHLKIDWTTSPSHRFDLAPGEEARFMCRPRGNAITAIGYAMFARNKYLVLEREDASPV